jgi:hypothetical protein
VSVRKQVVVCDALQPHLYFQKTIATASASDLKGRDSLYPGRGAGNATPEMLMVTENRTPFCFSKV